MNCTCTPVFPLLPSYLPSGTLDHTNIARYVAHLRSHGATTIMTTSGTSQFNLMSNDEVSELNTCAASAFPGRVILGAPLLAEGPLERFIESTTERHPTAELLLTYPERAYNDSDISDFFIRIARACPVPLKLHGLPLRRAQGGVQDLTGRIIDEITSAASNITGMKEECSTYEAGFRLCSSVTRHASFEFIVAGGSMRRYLLLQAAGAQSFLSGVGSLYPSVELAFARHMDAGRLREATSIISLIETPVFQVFMEIGWHKALRHAAKTLGLLSGGERRPMTEPTREERSDIEQVLLRLKDGMNRLSESGVL